MFTFTCIFFPVIVKTTFRPKLKTFSNVKKFAFPLQIRQSRQYEVVSLCIGKFIDLNKNNLKRYDLKTKPVWRLREL